MYSSTPGVVKSRSRYACRVLFGRLEADRVEALLDRAGAFVRGKDALALGDQGLGGLVQLVVGHAVSLPFGCLPETVSPAARPEAGFSGKRTRAAADPGDPPLTRLSHQPALAGLESGPSADVAQLVEHWLPKPGVAGSNPVVRLSQEGLAA